MLFTTSRAIHGDHPSVSPRDHELAMDQWRLDWTRQSLPLYGTSIVGLNGAGSIADRQLLRAVCVAAVGGQPGLWAASSKHLRWWFVQLGNASQTSAAAPHVHRTVVRSCAENKAVTAAECWHGSADVVGNVLFNFKLQGAIKAKKHKETYSRRISFQVRSETTWSLRTFLNEGVIWHQPPKNAIHSVFRSKFTSNICIFVWFLLLCFFWETHLMTRQSKGMILLDKEKTPPHRRISTLKHFNTMRPWQLMNSEEIQAVFKFGNGIIFHQPRFPWNMEISLTKRYNLNKYFDFLKIL